MSTPTHASSFAAMDPAITQAFDNSQLGPEFANELRTVSRLWFACGYRPGIAAYLNFFLLADFIRIHDERQPARFSTFKTMAKSFYETDLFIRDVTDSGREPTGGISNPRVREQLAGIMARHAALSIPPWMMTYFGLSLFENVEKQRGDMSSDERRWHLGYMSKTYRIMGIPFSEDRDLLTRFGRAVEADFVGVTPQLESHARHILRLGEMIGVSSRPDSILPMLPAATRKLFAPLARPLRPGGLRRCALRVVGRVMIGRAVGAPRDAVPVSDAAVPRR